MSFDPMAPPFFAGSATDRARAAWAADRAAFERLAEVSRTVRDADPEQWEGRALADERRELEVRLGLTCTAIPESVATRSLRAAQKRNRDTP